MRKYDVEVGWRTRLQWMAAAYVRPAKTVYIDRFSNCRPILDLFDFTNTNDTKQSATTGSFYAFHFQ